MMKKEGKIFSLILAILILTSFASYAQADEFQLPEPNSYFYVYDEAGIIDNSLANYIINTNEALHSRTGAQVVVASVSSLQDRTPEEFANLLFREWEIGDKEKNNGVLILIAPNEKQLWIEVGYGLEGALPDGKVGEIRDKDIFPYFREDNYSEGILQGFNVLLSAIENEYGIEIDRQSGGNNYQQNDTKEERGLFGSIRNILAAIGIVIFLIIDFTFFRGTLTFMILRMAMRGGGRGGHGGGGNRGGGGSSGGGGAGGGW